MGFLDKRQRVVDLVLTEHGRRLYAQGKLNFAYFTLFDDEVDYDPWSTGSLDDQARETLVEDTLVLEPFYVKQIRPSAVGVLEPTSHLFTAKQGYVNIPRLSMSPSSSFEVDCSQRGNVETHYRRFDSTMTQVDLSVLGDDPTSHQGFIVEVYGSSSSGLQELEHRYDFIGQRSYDPFLAIGLDDENVTGSLVRASSDGLRRLPR